MDKKSITKLTTYFILGDGGVYYPTNGKNAQFIMNMTSDHIDYIDWVQDTLEHITSVRRYSRKDYNIDGCNRKPQIRIESSVHPFFTTLRERIYIDSYKGIDEHSLKFLDWECMSILYMSDGNLYEDLPNKKRGLANTSWNLNLNMKRLSYGDCVMLKKAVKEKLGVEFNVNRNGKYYYLRLRSKDISTFCYGVIPYMKESFMYKVRMINPLSKGGDIVCTPQKCGESDRNDQITI